MGKEDEQCSVSEQTEEEKYGNKIQKTLCFFRGRELNGKRLVAEEVLQERLEELSDGRQVPVIIFNCLEMSLQQAETGAYPRTVFSESIEKSMIVFYEKNIHEVNQQLRQIGNPNVTIIVPDSELDDTRVFSFTQPPEKRVAIGRNVKTSLAKNLPYPVLLWSEYCFRQGLDTPQEYAQRNYRRISQDINFRKKVIDRTKDSKRYFSRNGLDGEYISTIPQEVIYEQAIRQAAIYTGEGQALSDSQAIIVNLEDQRVTAWFQRGADGKLPIVTPVDPTTYYRWRNSQRNLQSK